MPDNTSNADKTNQDTDSLHRQLRGELKDELEKWSQDRISAKHATFTLYSGLVNLGFALLTAAIAIFSVVGIPAMVDKAVEPRVEHRLKEKAETWKNWEELLKSSYSRVAQAEATAVEAATTAKVRTDLAVAHADKATKDAEDAINRAKVETDKATAQAQHASKSAELAANAADAASARLLLHEAPQERVPSEQASAIGAADKSAVWIKQEARKTAQPVRENDTSVYTELTFSVYIDTSHTALPPTVILSEIERVVYKFNSRWFNPSEQIVKSPADNFSYSIRVWGATSVTAEIYFKGVAKPVIRSGFMDLNNTTFFKPTESV